MPPLSATTNKPVAAERKIKRAKKKRAYTRPPIAAQPGPMTDAETRKVKRNTKKPAYQKSLQKARVHGPATRRGTGPGEAKGDEEFKKGQRYVRAQYLRYHAKGKRFADPDTIRYHEGTTVPPDVRERTAVRKFEENRKAKNAATAAPVLKALDQTTRPLHGLAAAERAVIKGVKRGGLRHVKPGEVGKAFVKGIKNEDKSTTRDVLKDVGIRNKVVLAVGGFTGDVLGDPTTYVTGGLGSVARKAALDAAKAAEKKALAAGLTREQAERMGHRAAKAAEKKASTSRGVTVEFAGREAPGVRRATAAVGRTVKKATDKPKIVRRTKEGGRHLVADVNPGVTPDNISREAYSEVRRATRTARSTTARQVVKTKERAASIKRAVGGADKEILDAIESGTIRHLPAEKRQVAKRLQDQFKYARRLERRAGIPVKERKGYVPHALKAPEEHGKKLVQGVGAKKITPSFSKARKEQRTLAEIRKTAPGKYQEDAAVLYANRLIESHVAANKATLNRRLLDMGRRVRRGDDVEIGTGEKVFNVKGSDIREVTDRKEMQRFVDSGDGGKGGQYVILNEQTVDRAVKNVVPQAERSSLGRTFDRVQGGWKWLATVPNVGFHVRNLVGDAQNAYLGQPARKLVVNTGRAARTLKRVSTEEEHLRRAAPGTPVPLKGKGVRVAGKTVSYEHLIREAENVGAIRSGFINREIPELTAGKGNVTKLRRSGGKTGRAFKRFIQNREDLFRLASYMHGRNLGLAPEQAAQRAAKFHFDYADLTSFERSTLRRLFPFYTFSARNIPLQLTSYFTRPGKFAQYQKVRENFAKAFGIDLDDNENNLTEYEQRSAPVPIKWKGAAFSLSFGPSGLPLTDLNELPVSTNPKKAADEWFQRAVSLLSPGPKSVLEYGMNYSFFFRDQLERDEGPLVPAPGVVAQLPASLQKKLGIVPDYVDKRTGKKTWGWPAKMDYIANTVGVGPFGLAKRVTTSSDRAGESTGAKLVASTGVRMRKVDAASAEIGRFYDEKAGLSKKRSALNQRGIHADNATPEWHKLSDRINEIDDEIRRLRRKRGDKIVPSRGRSRVRVQSRGGLFGGGSGGSSSGGGGLFDGGGSSSSGSGGGLFD